MRALARKRDERYGSAREFARALATQCGDLLYDRAQRSDFMKGLFEGRVAATAALFEAAHQPDQPVLLDAALLGLEQHALAISPPAPKASGPGARRKKKVEVVERDDTSQVNERLLLLALEADRLGEKPRRVMMNLTMPFIVVVTVLLCVGLAYKLFVIDRRPTRSGLQRFAGDPIDEEEGAPVVATSLAPSPSSFKPHQGLPGVDTTDTVAVASPTLVIPAPVLKIEKPQRGQGEVTLAIFPEASVFRGAEKLGSGNLISFALPAGTHRLTVVGADGVRHVLPLSVSAGKNKPQRFRLEDLPAK